MTLTTEMSTAQPAPAGVSIVARLVPAFSYAIPMLGASLSSLLIVRAFQGMRYAETAGIGAVTAGIAEANLPILIGLYSAIFVGVIAIVVIVVRCFVSTTTASPSGWFFLVGGGLGFIPLVLLWKAESLLSQAISPGYRGGIVQVASTIQLYLTLTPVTAAGVALVLLVATIVPVPSILRAKRTYAPLVALVMIEVLLMGMAAAFQVRTSWLQQVAITERF